MDLKNKQLKEAFGNLVTIGTSAGTPTTGGLENGNGDNITQVGIGTDSPSSALHLESASSPKLIIKDTTNNCQFIAYAQDSNAHLGTSSNHDFIIDTNNTERMKIDSGGNAIFTKSGGAYLQLKDASSVRGAINVTTSDGLVFTTGSSFTERMRIDSSGNVGIGASSPDAPLTVHNSSDPEIRLGYSASQDHRITWDSSKIFIDADPDNANASSGVGLRADGTLGLFVDSSQNVGIGTDSAEKRLHIKDSTQANQAIRFGNPSATPYGEINYDASGFEHLYIRAKGTTTGYGSIVFESGGSLNEAMRIDSVGNLLIGTTATPSSSAGNIVLKNGTAPAGNATDGVILYSEDVSSSSELKVRDEAGNVTTLSPHNFSLIPEGASEPMAWSYYSEKNGKKINVDMLKLARMVESLTGEKLIYEQ